MSDNVAEPTGEVKNNIEEPILGDNGVNYDVYADDASASNNSSNEGAFFDSKEYEKRQKTELITNVKGADRIKRQEERAREKETRERIKNLNKIAAVDNSDAIANEKLNKEQKNLQRRIARDKTGRKVSGVVFSKRTWIIIGIFVLVLVFFVALYLFTVKPVVKSIEKTNDAKDSAANSTSSIQIDQNARQMARGGDLDGANSYFEKELNDASGNLKVYIAIAYSTFINDYYEDARRAQDVLDGVKNMQMSENTEDDFYNAYMATLRLKGDVEGAKEFAASYGREYSEN